MQYIFPKTEMSFFRFRIVTLKKLNIVTKFLLANR